jgi:predicted RNase H-like nuclease (RuvC/YqgF family)
LNATLRDQLEQTTQANQNLQQEIQKANIEWMKLREQFEQKEREWRSEENSLNDYFSYEHGKLVGLWRQVVSFRREFSEMKSLTERDLGKIKIDLVQNTRNMQSNCLNLTSQTKFNDSQAQVILILKKKNHNFMS